MLFVTSQPIKGRNLMELVVGVVIQILAAIMARVNEVVGEVVQILAAVLTQVNDLWHLRWQRWIG